MVYCVKEFNSKSLKVVSKSTFYRYKKLGYRVFKDLHRYNDNNELEAIKVVVFPPDNLPF